MPQSFQQDCVELALRRFRRGGFDRRALLSGLAALGAILGVILGAAVGAGPAVAQGGRSLVVVNGGGIANEVPRRFYGDPFTAANPGMRATQDITGPSAGRICSMVESRPVTWDLCDSSASSAVLLGGMNLLEKMDYSIIDRTKVISPGFALKHGAVPYSFSSVLAYDSSKFPTPPTPWADFCDLRRCPGQRLLRRDALGAPDAPMMSLDRAPAQVYPIDTRAAPRLVGELRRNTVYWNSGNEREQFMRTGWAVMGQIWHTRTTVVARETQGQSKFIWNQDRLQPGIFVAPRGNPGGELTQRLLAPMLINEEGQVGLLGLLGNGPTNPAAAAAARVSAEMRGSNPTDPENERQQLVLNGAWWGANYQQANPDFLETITV